MKEGREPHEDFWKELKFFNLVTKIFVSTIFSNCLLLKKTSEDLLSVYLQGVFKCIQIWGFTKQSISRNKNIMAIFKVPRENRELAYPP